MPEIVEIAEFSNEFEAQLALAHLRSDGIDARMVTDDGGGALPNLSMLTGGVRLVVRSADEPAALEALKGFSGDED